MPAEIEKKKKDEWDRKNIISSTTTPLESGVHFRASHKYSTIESTKALLSRWAKSKMESWGTLGNKWSKKSKRKDCR